MHTFTKLGMVHTCDAYTCILAWRWHRSMPSLDSSFSNSLYIHICSHCKGDKQLHCYRANTEKCRFIQRHDSGMMNSPDNFGPAAPSPTTPEPITLEPPASGNHTNKLNGTEENDSDPTQNDAFSLLRELFLDMFVRWMIDWHYNFTTHKQSSTIGEIFVVRVVGALS